MAQLNFQQSLLQSSGSHDPSEIILICLFATNVETVVLLTVIFFQIFWINGKFKRTAFIWIFRVFPVTFDQFHA